MKQVQLFNSMTKQRKGELDLLNFCLTAVQDIVALIAEKVATLSGGAHTFLGFKPQ